MSEITEWLAGINVALGAWLVVLPFVMGEAISTSTPFAFWNYVLVGAAIVALAGFNLWRADDDRPGSAVAAGITALLGLWVVVLPYVTEPLIRGWLIWHDGIVGGIVAVIGAFNAYRTVQFEGESEEAAT